MSDPMLRYLYKLIDTKPSPRKYGKTRLWLETYEERIVLDGGSGDGGGNPGDGSQAGTWYPLYFRDGQRAYGMAVDAAIQSAVAKVRDADFAAFSGMRTAYENYLAATQNSYTNYLLAEELHRTILLQSIADAYLVLAQSINSAHQSFDNTFTLAGEKLDIDLLLAHENLTSTFVQMDIDFVSASQSAWDAMDIPQLEAAEVDWYEDLAAAAGVYNSSFLTAVNSFSDTVIPAFDLMATKMYAAEAVWTTTVTAAVRKYLNDETTSWERYLNEESTAWNSYRSQKEQIILVQIESVNAAKHELETAIANAIAQYYRDEPIAWQRYLDSLAPGADTGTRQPDPPTIEKPALAPAYLGDWDTRRQQPRQQQLPEIDWTKGEVTKMIEVPNGYVLTNTAEAYRFQIGKQADGTPIFIHAIKNNNTPAYNFRYNCHGLTFAGEGRYIISTTSSVEQILNVFYKQIDEKDVQANDIGVVYNNDNGYHEHSFTILSPVFNTNGTLSPSSSVRSKNGNNPEVSGPPPTLGSILAIYVTTPAHVTKYYRKLR